MRRFNFGFMIVLISLSAGAQAAYGQICVTSDSDDNTACGSDTLPNGAGNANSAFGQSSLGVDTTGAANTAVGAQALQTNSIGSQNTAVGAQALEFNTAGNQNTAIGNYALQFSTVASNNTACGYAALYQNTTGSYNTATGDFALGFNDTGFNNTAVGYWALLFNGTGANNTALGYSALKSNTTGKGNVAQGVNSLYDNTTGIRNTGLGNNALYLTNGSYNIALGFDAGYNVGTGNNNIEIGSAGAASDDGTIQIGVQGTQTVTTIAGIYGTQVSGNAVYVTSTGQLGVQPSSERFKTDIAAIPQLSDKLRQLRPVVFHYKTDPKHVTQYGLIAEEVAGVYPELVIRDGSGMIMGVHYEELAPILLSEVQRQQTTIQSLSQRQDALSESNARQAAEIRELKKIVADIQAGVNAARADATAPR